MPNLLQKNVAHRHARGFFGYLLAVNLLLLLVADYAAIGAGVTVITHGFNGNVTDWIIPMCGKIPQYQSFPGTNFSTYQISITKTGTVYYVTEKTLSGVNPLTSDSGEIIIALDWSTLAGIGPATTVIATQAVTAILATNLIPELNGHSLAEWPLHLVGHSRGASVVTEMARVLGAQGIWVDHITTFDPFPVGGIGDPPINNYANVLFADNYWQNTDFPQGQSISGAYNRFLTNVTGGYPAGSAHSDTHLWYHGTIDLATPATDTQATITAAERANWCTSGESRGTNTGFLYSLIGKGDRLSTAEPAGTGTGQIRSGLNTMWDFGAGLSANRTSLGQNNGTWPNLIRLDIPGTHWFAAGDPVPLRFYHQYGSSTSTTANVRFFLDRDPNPNNGTETEIGMTTIAGTGTNQVTTTSLNILSDPATIAPGTYALFAKIECASHSRLIYAGQMLSLGSSRQPPSLAGARVQGGQFQFTVSGFPGQKIIIQGSSNLVDWVSIQTNVLSATSTNFADAASAVLSGRYYRAMLGP